MIERKKPKTFAEYILGDVNVFDIHIAIPYHPTALTSQDAYDPNIYKYVFLLTFMAHPIMNVSILLSRKIIFYISPLKYCIHSLRLRMLYKIRAIPTCYPLIFTEFLPFMPFPNPIIGSFIIFQQQIVSNIYKIHTLIR